MVVKNRGARRRDLTEWGRARKNGMLIQSGYFYMKNTVLALVITVKIKKSLKKPR
jgi:hypothetical protein